MKYDLKKLLVNDALITLQWHGEDTKVLVRGDGEKTEVKKGDTLKVSVGQARELLNYSYLWTLEGDEPVKHQYNDMLAKLATKAAKKAAKTDKAEETGNDNDNDDDEEITADDVDKMKKPELVTALKKLGASFNDQANKAELAGLLKETLAAKTDKVEEII